MFKEYGANYVIMKDSGSTGGTMEKIKACERIRNNTYYNRSGRRTRNKYFRRIRKYNKTKILGGEKWNY